MFALASGVYGCFAFAGVGFRDSGEIGAAAFRLGVAHPTGFAANMLLFRLAAYLPLGTNAWRQNLAVALTAAAALALVAELTSRLARRTGVTAALPRLAGALVAAAALGAWGTFSSSALSVEVYASALLLLGLGCLGALAAGSRKYWIALGMGLAPSIHMMCALPLLALWLARALPLVQPVRPRVWLVGGVALLCSALLVVYLPLASLRDPPLDWGDPETLAAFWQHLTAARIRAAYAGQMLGAATPPWMVLAAQLGQLWLLLPLAAAGLWLLARAERRLALLAFCLLSLDLAYALWVNPMGVADRQVGQLAGAVVCVLGGLAVARALGRTWSWAPGRPGGLLLTGLLGVWVASPFAKLDLLQSSIWDELHGGGGPLSKLPPRAVLVCYSDDVCAGALFALHADGVRPDVAVVAAQHLWDPVTVRSLTGLSALARWGGVPAPPAGQRPARVRAALAALLETGVPRPVRWESDEPLRASGLQASLTTSSSVPFLRAHPDLPDSGHARQHLVKLDRLRTARLGTCVPRSRLAQHAWAATYGRFARGALGEQHLTTALLALERAITLAPDRPQAWTNLGLVHARAGNLRAALDAYQRALELDPSRAAVWVNLIALELSAGDSTGARRALELALDLGIQDRRLQELRSRLYRHEPTSPLDRTERKP
ncbi:MAG: tetratricopeptide repeat protein [Proteobacteria bacterium]|nr:tetratricopeptide repeat protein [Pseudomonadota bacterium]